jgi:hypothetical protein
MDSEHLLVPIKVQALVIDDIVINKSGVVERDRKIVANDGRWSPVVYNYQQLLASLKAPGPRPFYGATRKYQNRDTAQLVLDPITNKEALPQNQDRGVYLHWVLPAGLRHAYTPGSLDFPPLPDHWLIVRFSRNDSVLKTRAWFIDGAAVVTESPTNLLFPGKDRYVVKRIGKVVPLEQFATADFSGERTTINAIGNVHTSSPTFTASIAENRNVFSFHDKLEDLRTPNTTGKVREETTLTYCVLGWYREPQNDPLSATAAKVTERRDEANKLLGWLINPPGWSIDAASEAPVTLLRRRSVFHGMVAHINYWSGDTTYKGHMLGYPGSPLVGGAMGKSEPAFKVGVGNSAEDALVSLVSSEYSGEQQKKSLAKEQPNLWKALEAVIYRQTETLVRRWNVAPRDMIVHQNSFATHEAGKIWYIRPLSDQRGMFPAAADKTAAETAAKPTAEHLTKLKDLNQLQSEADGVSRDLAALQQDLYARWWKLCAKSRTFDDLDADETQCRNLVSQVKTLRDRLNGLLTTLRPLPDELKSKLPKDELELKYDAAPRFWLPADPVIVVKNCGTPDKHQFSRQHPCRLPEQIVTAVKVLVNGEVKTINTATGVADIAAAAQKHLPACPPILNGLLNEASLVEQAIRNLIETTLGDKKVFADVAEWTSWTNRWDRDLTWDGKSAPPARDQITFEPESANIRPDRLVDLWVQQPWSPLFIDWQVTWLPTPQPPTPDHPFGPEWNFDEADFVPLDRQSIPKQQGYTVRGRSLLSPIDDRIFKEPLDTLGKLLEHNGGKEDSAYPPAVTEVLKRYEVVWSETLSELPRGGLMGQALTGFHQSLLSRDVTFPRITPDATHPWIKSTDLKSLEDDVRALLEIDGGTKGERLAPPTTSRTGIPFSLIRAGALRIDELWLIDDFGQFADLLGQTAAGSMSSGQVFHPRIRWHDDPKVFAMPPRVLQPVRLNFRFTAATENHNEPSNNDPLSAIYGWIFYNPLDQALVLCDRKGELVGHLVIVKDNRGSRINWEAGVGGMALNNVFNPSLKAFAESLVEPNPTAKPRLLELLNLIDNALERIRPAAARRDSILVGRPLALVSASVGLELFGKAWTDPTKDAPALRTGSGNQSLDALRVRVNLGDSHSTEDGLIGYFKDGAYQRIVVPELSDHVRASEYIGDPQGDGLRVGLGTPQRLTLLMDPWGSVQAACGLVPAKTITFAHPELNKTVARMETSFHVGPVLLPADRFALPTPTGNKGSWNFAGPLTEQKAAAVVPLDPKYFGDQPIVATEGRLVLLNEEGS